MSNALNDRLAAKDVTVDIAGRAILRKVSAAVEPGTVTALVGPNGAGKSTLLRALCGDHDPIAGSITLNGRRLADIGIAEQARLRSVMSQSSGVAFDFLVDDILRMGWVQSGETVMDAFECALSAVIRECDIRDLLHRTFNTLSGGEQQRVQFARALLQIWPEENSKSARYLLLDEPTSSLDLGRELLVLRLARRAAARRIGVLVVLHDLNLAARFADAIVLLERGRVIASGSPADVLDSERLSEVYRTPVQVEQHAGLDRLVVYS